MVTITVRKQYNQITEIYDWCWRPCITHTLSFLKYWVQNLPEASALDIASFTGEFKTRIPTKTSIQQMVGVDISDKMLAIDQGKYRTYPNIEFHTTSVTSLSLPQQPLSAEALSETQSEMGIIFLINGKSFDHPQIYTKVFLNTVEDGEIRNEGIIHHPFHLHTNPFQITNCNGQIEACQTWKDTFLIQASAAMQI